MHMSPFIMTKMDCNSIEKNLNGASTNYNTIIARTEINKDYRKTQ